MQLDVKQIVLLDSLLLFSTLGLHARNVNPKPNIILILADDQGWGDISFNGNTTVSTPNIDRIARKGVYFENFYVCPLSSPTRTELLTGRYSFRTGVTDVWHGKERLNLNEKTVAEYLKQAGYATALFGKWHNGSQYPYYPNARGFDHFYGFCSGGIGNYWNSMLEENGKIVYGENFITDDLTDHAIDYIDRNRDSPFFMFLSYNAPHTPLQVTDDWWNIWQHKKLEQFATNSALEDTVFTKATLALTENLDWNIGRVIRQLEERNIDDNTIILYMTDNGPNNHRWNGGMKGKKGNQDEGGVRSPLMIRWPQKIKQHRRIDQLSGAIDLLPTLLGLTGEKNIRYKNPPDGIDLSGMILTEKHNPIDRDILTYWKNRLSIRSMPYLLTDREELFDIVNDREQRNNLAQTRIGEKAQLMRKREDFRQQITSALSGMQDLPYTVGDKRELYTKLPVRDAHASGSIERITDLVNDSYFTNWTNTSDSVFWEVDVLEPGIFEVIVYYTCSEYNIGSKIQFGDGKKEITCRLTQIYDQPMIGADLDRIPRHMAHFKGFSPASIGEIELSGGKRYLSIKAKAIPNREVMSLFMVVLKRMI